MKSRSWLGPAMAFLLAGLVAGRAQAAEDECLFDWISSTAARAVIPAGTPSPRAEAAIRWRGERADVWRGGERRRLPLPDGSSLAWVIDDVGVRDGGSEVQARGRVEGESGSRVDLVVREGRVAGRILRPGRSAVMILPRESGGHGVVETPGEGVDCGTVSEAGLDFRRAWLHAAESGTSAGAKAVLDVMFLVTAAAEAAAGGAAGMEALIQLAVIEANDAFARSEARVVLRPVYVGRTDYVESGELSLDLARLARSGDGHLDDAARLRDVHAADLVCLVTEWESSNRLAGMAYQLRDLSAAALEQGYLVCLRPYIIGNYTLPHEVGHVLGCTHDRQNAGGGGLEPWSYGTRIDVEGTQYRTVMAYRPGLQFPHFSNPRVAYRGVPTGVAAGAAAADNVRTLNTTAPLVAGVRSAAVRAGFSQERIEVSESAGYVRVPWTCEGACEGFVARLRTVPGSALADRDYGSVDKEIAGAGGIVEIALLDNCGADGTRRFSVELFQASPGASLGPVATATVVVRDDEEDGRAPLDTRFRSRVGADYLVSALAVASGGGVMAGGGFTRFDGADRPRLARVRQDGRVDPGFRAEVKYRVEAIAGLADGRWVIGGEFNTVNGVRLNHVALLEPDGRVSPGFQFEEGTDGPVRVVLPAPDGATLWIAGAFTNVQGMAVSHVARLDLGGNVVGGGGMGRLPGPAASGGLDGDGRIVLGGRRGAAASEGPGYVTRLRADGLEDPGFAGLAWDGLVEALAVDGQGRWVVGGRFRTVGGVPAAGVVRLSPDGTVDPGFQVGAGTDGPVHAIAAWGGRVWIGGAFTRVQGLERRRLARLRDDGSLDPSFDPGTGPNDTVLAMVPSGEGVVIGGVFTEVSGVARGGVAAILGAAAGPARFTGLGWDSGGLAWEATVEAGQLHLLESSGELRAWESATRVEPEGADARGLWRPAGGSHGFVRLRRILE